MSGSLREVARQIGRVREKRAGERRAECWNAELAAPVPCITGAAIHRDTFHIANDSLCGSSSSGNPSVLVCHEHPSEHGQAMGNQFTAQNSRIQLRA